MAGQKFRESSHLWWWMATGWGKQVSRPVRSATEGKLLLAYLTRTQFLKIRALHLFPRKPFHVTRITPRTNQCYVPKNRNRLIYDSSKCSVTSSDVARVNLLRGGGSKSWHTLRFCRFLMKFIQYAFPCKSRWPKWQCTEFIVWNGGSGPQIYVWGDHGHPRDAYGNKSFQTSWKSGTKAFPAL